MWSDHCRRTEHTHLLTECLLRSRVRAMVLVNASKYTLEKKNNKTKRNHPRYLVFVDICNEVLMSQLISNYKLAIDLFAKLLSLNIGVSNTLSGQRI